FHRCAIPYVYLPRSLEVIPQARGGAKRDNVELWNFVARRALRCPARSVLLDRRFDVLRRDVVVRRRPHRFPILHQDQLRRLVLHIEKGGDGVADRARLDHKHLEKLRGLWWGGAEEASHTVGGAPGNRAGGAVFVDE